MNEIKKLFDTNKSLSELVIDYIKQEIVNGNLQQGSQINLQALMSELNISQTPVREAIKFLVGKNIIDNIRNKGFYIKEYNVRNVFEIYSMRAVLEGAAMRLAIQNENPKEWEALRSIYTGMKEQLGNQSIESLSKEATKVHNQIINMSNHRLLIEAYENISLQVILVNSILSKKYSKDKEVVEHGKLIEALESKDADLAEHLMREHIYQSYLDFLKMKNDIAMDAEVAGFQHKFPL